MADRVLFVSWGAGVRGAEERGLEVFNDALGLFGRMQQDGRVESFNVTLLDPNGALNGYVELHGTAEQLAAVRESEDFQRSMLDAALIVDDFRLISGHTNEGIAAQMALYQEAIGKVPQRT